MQPRHTKTVKHYAEMNTERQIFFVTFSRLDLYLDGYLWPKEIRAPNYCRDRHKRAHRAGADLPNESPPDLFAGAAPIRVECLMPSDGIQVEQSD